MTREIKQRVRIALMCLGLCMIGIMACRDDVLAPPTPMDDLYWELRTNYEAVQLSVVPPYDTAQLVTIPLNPDGVVWTRGSDSVALHDTTIWSSADSSKVKVSQTGFLTARAATNGILVTVTRQIGTVTHKDTIRVQVSTLTNPPVLTTFSIRPIDSLKRAMSFLPIALPMVLHDQRDSAISGLPVAYRSSNHDIGRFNNKWLGSMITRSVAGTTLISAATYAYGVAKTDTFTLEIGWWLSLIVGNPAVVQQVLPDGTTIFASKSSRQDIGPSGTVYWENASAIRPTGFTGTLLPGKSMDVVFDDTTNVLEALPPRASGSGNITGIPSDSTLTVLSRRGYRQFRQPGEYPYTIQPFGFRGVVVVHDR